MIAKQTNNGIRYSDPRYIIKFIDFHLINLHSFELKSYHSFEPKSYHNFGSKLCRFREMKLMNFILFRETEYLLPCFFGPILSNIRN